MNYFFICAVSFSIALAFTMLFYRLERKYNLLSQKGIPCIGGISMGASFLVICLFFAGKSFRGDVLKGILLPALAMLSFGVIDDYRELSVIQKFFVQIIAVTLMFLFGIKAKIAGIGGIVNAAVTFIWVIGITNAFNHLDIMDGLAAASAIIVSSAFFIVSLLNNDLETAFFSCVLIGIILSFLIYNFPPAKIYMGNSGSHFLGFLLAALALLISYAPMERKIALLSPIFILGLPIFDTAFLIFMRIKKGKSMLLKSNDHLALRLLKSGHSKRKALFYMVFWIIFFALAGVLISRFSIFISSIIVIVTIFASLTVLAKKAAGVFIEG